MCNKEGLHIDTAGLDALLRSHMDKKMILYRKLAYVLVTKIVPSTSCAPFDMQWSWSEIWGNYVRPHIRYGLASMVKELNSESFQKKAHEK